MVTRSQSGIVRPIDRLSLHTTSISPLPKSPFLALQIPHLNNAMHDEYNALDKNGTWILVPRPAGINLVRSMWLFKHKFHADGTLSRYKARLVANDSSLVLTVMKLSVQWSSQPQTAQSLVLQSLKSLYGLKHAPRACFQRFAGYATCVGFYHSRCDSSLFILRQGSQQVITSLHNEFDMTDLGALNYFLGISATRHSTRLFLSQKQYAIELLARAHMTTCNSSRTPVDTNSKLGPEDISYAVQHIFLYMHDPREPYLAALKRILRYIQRTLDFGFHLYSSTTISLVGYTDADWAGCPSTRRSTSGYCVFLGDNLLSWSSKRQQTISRFSAEAEYRGVANVVAETAWLRNLLRELHSPLSAATLVYCDNVSAIYLSANPVQHQRTKHIEIDIHFVRDLVTAGQVRVLHVPSRYQYADIFTKGLLSSLFEDFRSSLSVRLPLAPTAREY
nr:ribonuclease H-like domain-containing protein [Tanacetum cinerariifolium]